VKFSVILGLEALPGLNFFLILIEFELRQGGDDGGQGKWKGRGERDDFFIY
jgi:hypothetical protein